MSKQLKTRCEGEFKKAVEQAANREDKTMAAWLRDAARNHLPEDLADGAISASSGDEGEPSGVDVGAYQEVAEGLDSLEELGDALPDAVTFPIEPGDIEEIEVPKTYKARLPLMRAMVEDLAGKADADTVSDAFVRPVHQAQFDLHETTMYKDLERMPEMGVAYPLPGADPQFDRSELLKELIEVKARVGGARKADVENGYDDPSEFFAARDEDIVPSGDEWYLNDVKCEAELSRQLDLIVRAWEEAEVKTARATTSTLLRFFIEYLEGGGMLEDRTERLRARLED